MSVVKELKAVARDRVGKGAARALRRNGQIPAVIYGGGAEPAPIALDANQARLLIFGGGFLTTLFEVEVDGRKTRVIPRDYHLDPVKDFPLHVDFLRVKAGQTLEVEVPVHFVNQDTSPGLKNGGVLNIVSHTILVEAPADRIPDAIEVDVAGLDMGSSIHVSDVKMPSGVSTALDGSVTVATIAAPAGLGAEVEAEEAAVAEAQREEAEADKAEAAKEEADKAEAAKDGE